MVDVVTISVQLRASCRVSPTVCGKLAMSASVLSKMPVTTSASIHPSADVRVYPSNTNGASSLVIVATPFSSTQKINGPFGSGSQMSAIAAAGSTTANSTGAKGRRFMTTPFLLVIGE